LRAAVAWLVFLGLLVVGSDPARAGYPAPWPDSGSSDVDSGWTPYTYEAVPAYDNPSSSDQSTGGTTPNQEADVVSDGGTRPSVYYAFDAVNQVLFFRFRLARSAFNNSPDGGSRDDPLKSTWYNVLIDLDGDGFREFIVELDGNSGSPGTPLDRFQIHYSNTPDQSIPGTPIYETVAGLYPDADARAAVIDLKNVRSVAPSLTGPAAASYYIDMQVPLSAFVVGGTPLLTATTPISFGYATANSNSNPFQKDAVYNGAITVGVNTPFPFGDVLTPGGGIVQEPVVRDVVASCSRPAEVLQATVRDTLVVSGGVAVNTIDSVRFYWQPDANGDGIPDPGSSPTLITTLTAPVPGRVDLYEYTWDTSAMPGGTFDIFAVATDRQGNQGTSPPAVCTFTALPVSVSGTVFQDADHDAFRDPGETGPGLPGLYVKMVPASGGSAVAAVPVDPTSGAYTFSGVVTPAGSYFLRLDDNATLGDTAASRPAGWVGTLAPTQERSVVVGPNDLVDQDFGLFHGSTLSGTVFLDDGSGGGTAHDGLRQGGEPGLPGVDVGLFSGSTRVEATATGAEGFYRLFLPHALGGASLSIQETNPPGATSVSGSPGNTGGAYSLAQDRVTFVYNAATESYFGVDFGDVGATLFLTDGQAQARPGGTVLYPHRFVAGTAGTVSFTLAREAWPDLPNWSSVLYQDLDGDGALDAGEPPIDGPLTVAAGQEIRLLLKETVPLNAPEGARDLVTITASMQPTGAGQPVVLTRTDLTLVTGGAAVRLRKEVDLTSARSGQVLTYTITYQNTGTEALGDLVIHDGTPAYTTFVSALCGALPPGLTGCTVATPPASGEGALTWTFTGVLHVGASGTVTFQVRVR